MILKGNKLCSILKSKCPQCHEGAFLERKIYDFSAFTKVRKTCPNCQLNYHVEPSFYYGPLMNVMAKIIWANFFFNYNKDWNDKIKA